MTPRWFLLLMGFMALPLQLRAQGTPECPQVITCVAGNIFTEPGDVDCNRSLELTDLALLVQAPFCDACKTCMGKDVNGDSRVSVADVTALLELLPPGLPTPTHTATTAPTSTRTRTATSTNTAISTSTATNPIATATRSATVTRSATPTITLASTSTPTATGTPLNTSTETPTATRSQTVTATRTPTENTATQYSFAFLFGGPGTTLPSLLGPVSAIIAPNGHVWTADARDRILELDGEGGFLRAIGTSGTGNGEFRTPRGIAFDPMGNIYVADAMNSRIQKFSSAGDYLDQFGGAEKIPQNLALPTCVVVRGGVVFVCDTNHNRMARFTTAGVFQGAWGTSGSDPGEFDQPVDLAFDSNGYAYVADFGIVQKFDASFAFVAEIGATDDLPARLILPTGLAVSPDDTIYVSGRNKAIKIYNADGDFQAEYGDTGSDEGEFNNAFDVGIDANGDVYVADRDNNRLQKLTADIAPLLVITDGLRGRFVAPLGIAYSTQSGILVSDTVGNHGRIAFFEGNGQPDRDVRISGGNVGLNNSGAGIAIAPSGDIYLADAVNNSIVKLDSNRVVVKFFGTPGTGPGQFMKPAGVAVDDIGNVYVVDADNNRVQKFDSNGVFLDIWGGFGTANGQFDNPFGIAVYADRVYVTDNGNSRVQVFNRSGDFLTKWGESGADPGQFRSVAGIAVDPDGYVYVLDAGHSRVQKFTPNGGFIVAFGDSGPGQLIGTTGIAVAGNGDVLVVSAAGKVVLVWQAPQ